MKSCQDLTFRKFSRRFNPPQKKGGFTLWNYHQFFKNFQTKTKPVVRGYIYWLDSRYTMSDGKNKLFLNCYTNIRDTMHLSCLTFRMDGASTRAILCCGWAWNLIVQKSLFEKWGIICYLLERFAPLIKH